MSLLFYSLVLQVCAALVGALMTFRSKVDADKTMLFVTRSSVNGSRKTIASKNVRIENVILVIQASLFLVGIATMFLGEFPTDHPDVTNVMLIRSVDMAFISILLTWLSYRNWVELVPIMASRRSDVPPDTRNGLANVVSSAKVAQDLAASAQVAAAGAQTAASDAQATASDLLQEDIEAAKGGPATGLPDKD